MNEPKPNIKYAKALVHVWSLDQTPAGPGFACALAKKSLEWQQDRIAELEAELEGCKDWNNFQAYLASG